MLMYPKTKNIVVPAGYCFFDEVDDAGVYKGEQYMAETPSFTLAINGERLEDWTSDGPTAELQVDIPTKTQRSAKFTMKNITDEGLAIFVIGDLSTLSTSAASVTDSVINKGNPVYQGRWYQLGVDDANMPAGVRDILNLAIHDSIPNVFTDVDDYIKDLATGRVYVVKGGGIPDGTVILGDYDTQARTWSQISSNDLGAKRGAFRVVADNTHGENRDTYLPNVVLSPDGELQLKSRDAVQQLGFGLSLLTPDDGRSAVYINGRAVA